MAYISQIHKRVQPTAIKSSATHHHIADHAQQHNRNAQHHRCGSNVRGYLHYVLIAGRLRCRGHRRIEAQYEGIGGGRRLTGEIRTNRRYDRGAVVGDGRGHCREHAAAAAASGGSSQTLGGRGRRVEAVDIIGDELPPMPLRPMLGEMRSVGGCCCLAAASSNGGDGDDGGSSVGIRLGRTNTEPCGLPVLRYAGAAGAAARWRAAAVQMVVMVVRLLCAVTVAFFGWYWFVVVCVCVRGGVALLRRPFFVCSLCVCFCKCDIDSAGGCAKFSH